MASHYRSTEAERAEIVRLLRMAFSTPLEQADKVRTQVRAFPFPLQGSLKEQIGNAALRGVFTEEQGSHALTMLFSERSGAIMIVVLALAKLVNFDLVEYTKSRMLALYWHASQNLQPGIMPLLEALEKYLIGHVLRHERLKILRNRSRRQAEGKAEESAKLAIKIVTEATAEIRPPTPEMVEEWLIEYTARYETVTVDLKNQRENLETILAPCGNTTVLERVLMLDREISDLQRERKRLSWNVFGREIYLDKHELVQKLIVAIDSGDWAGQRRLYGIKEDEDLDLTEGQIEDLRELDGLMTQIYRLKDELESLVPQEIKGRQALLRQATVSIDELVSAERQIGETIQQLETDLPTTTGFVPSPEYCEAQTNLLLAKLARDEAENRRSQDAKICLTLADEYEHKTLAAETAGGAL